MRRMTTPTCGQRQLTPHKVVHTEDLEREMPFRGYRALNSAAWDEDVCWVKIFLQFSASSDYDGFEGRRRVDRWHRYIWKRPNEQLRLDRVRLVLDSKFRKKSRVGIYRLTLQGCEDETDMCLGMKDPYFMLEDTMPRSTYAVGQVDN